jgi:hypothetical protein
MNPTVSDSKPTIETWKMVRVCQGVTCLNVLPELVSGPRYWPESACSFGVLFRQNKRWHVAALG